jgi:leucyl aminopeptidase
MALKAHRRIESIYFNYLCPLKGAKPQDMINLVLADKPHKAAVQATLLTKKTARLADAGFGEADTSVIERLKDTSKPIALHAAEQTRFVQFLEEKKNKYQELEAARRAGAALNAEAKNLKLNEILLTTDSNDKHILLAYAEGFALADYVFSGYKKKNGKSSLETIYLQHKDLKEKNLKELEAVIEGTYIARDLVNSPFSHLNAEQFSEAIVETAGKTGLKVEVLNKSKIEALRMGGLLSVAAGSIDPPTFNIIEWKPKGAVNKKPIILVGKGVVFDTGGLTLKPTPNSMDVMKSDMAGGAAVVGAMHAIAKTQMPIYVVGLIPATDNRPGERATAPGDVITMYDGTSVEVLNTDAEGRLILADALTYAKKYKPELVLDLATLTGAAVRAIGQYGIAMMGTADEKTKQQLLETGNDVYERLVEFPFWDEYGDMLKSDIADLKNVSAGSTSGAITAGKFLEHFVDYPWLHLDIAGPAYLSGADSYRGKNATGVGVRLLFNFIKNRYQ